ncbi:MAG: hypothetical protein EP310_04015 [Bacteroidetes bacterium]|nr:MAG: hypothetical protein EP310_04015 [Bacteroidota bacterium]
MKCKIVLTVIAILKFTFVKAQQPDLLPPAQTEPLELTPFNIILYFVMPVIIFIIFFWYRKSKKKKNAK